MSDDRRVLKAKKRAAKRAAKRSSKLTSSAKELATEAESALVESLAISPVLPEKDVKKLWSNMAGLATQVKKLEQTMSAVSEDTASAGVGSSDNKVD